MTGRLQDSELLTSPEAIHKDAEEVVILQREMTKTEELVNKLVEALGNESVPFEDKCSVMTMLRHLLRNTCCDAGYNIAVRSLMATANITSESPNLAMFTQFTYDLLMKNAGHSSQLFPKIVLSLMEADECCCDEDLKQKTLLAIWNNQELLDLPMEVLELMALRWKLGLEVQCLQLCHNKKHIPQYLIKLCASSPRVFQACLSILASFLLEYNGHQQVQRLFRDLIMSVAVRCPTLWKLFPVAYQKLALFLQIDPDIYPEEPTAGMSRDYVLDLLTDVFYIRKNSNIVAGLIMISCFPKWLPYLVEFFNKKYKISFFSVACFVNKHCVAD